MTNPIEAIRDAIRAMKAEASGENRPDINRRLLDEVVARYKSVTHLDLSDADRDQTIRMLRSVSIIKRFLEMDEPQTAQSYLRGLISSIQE